MRREGNPHVVCSSSSSSSSSKTCDDDMLLTLSRDSLYTAVLLAAVLLAAVLLAAAVCTISWEKRKKERPRGIAAARSNWEGGRLQCTLYKRRRRRRIAE